MQFKSNKWRDIKTGDCAEIYKSHLDQFCKLHLMVTGTVVIACYRETINFIITRFELKSNSFVKKNRTLVHRRCACPYDIAAMASADFEKALIQ